MPAILRKDNFQVFVTVKVSRSSTSTSILVLRRSLASFNDSRSHTDWPMFPSCKNGSKRRLFVSSPHLRTKMFSNTTARVSCSNPAIHNRDPVQSMVRILGRQLEPTSSISSLGHTPGRDNQQLRNRYEDLLATADDYTAPLHTHTSDVRSAPFMIDRYSPILYFLI